MYYKKNEKFVQHLKMLIMIKLGLTKTQGGPLSVTNERRNKQTEILVSNIGLQVLIYYLKHL